MIAKFAAAAVAGIVWPYAAGMVAGVADGALFWLLSAAPSLSGQHFASAHRVAMLLVPGLLTGLAFGLLLAALLPERRMVGAILFVTCAVVASSFAFPFDPTSMGSLASWMGLIVVVAALILLRPKGEQQRAHLSAP